jgi:hypothetical protein
MTSIPENLVKQLVTVMNNNARFALGRDATGLQRVRDILIAAGCIEQVDLYDCAVIEDGCGHAVATGCAGCGRHGVHDDNGLCNDCRGPRDFVAECAEYGDCADCPEYGDCVWCED